MKELLILALILVVVITLIIGPIFLVAYIASQSRRKKQEKTLKQVPKQAEFKVAVRYNRGYQQDEVLKIKAFQGSGILYVLDQKICFRDTLNKNPYDFDLNNTKVEWIGVNLVNGFIQWFKIADDKTQYYFNVETGMFIWSLSSKRMTTKQLYNKLKSLM